MWTGSGSRNPETSPSWWGWLPLRPLRGPVCSTARLQAVLGSYFCADPKAGRRERNHGLVSNNENGRSEATPAVNDHETVKPIELMRWLVRLTTAPGATVLDPFTGSGSTGVACMLEGRSFIGIEQIPKYAEIAKRRIRRAAEDAAAASNSDGR